LESNECHVTAFFETNNSEARLAIVTGKLKTARADILDLRKKTRRFRG
jgi:hypothetical protein